MTYETATIIAHVVTDDLERIAKINLIKEVCTTCCVGLKEAKEAVEYALASFDGVTWRLTPGQYGKLHAMFSTHDWGMSIRATRVENGTAGISRDFT
jgi:hypothetical protein